MIPWGARYLITLSGLSYLAAVVYGVITGGNIVGVLSIGYKNGVGEHMGYGICIGLAFTFAGLAATSLSSREGIVIDNEGNHLPVAPVRSDSQSFSPPMMALSLLLIVCGIALSKVFLVVGLALGFMVALQWGLQAWADGFSDDEAANSVVKAKVGSVLDVPVMAIMLAGFVVIGISRILLAVSATNATVVAGGVAFVMFLFFVFVAKKNPSQKFVTGAIAIAALAILIGGIVAAGVGERSFDHGHEEASRGLTK